MLRPANNISQCYDCLSYIPVKNLIIINYLIVKKKNVMHNKL